MSAVPDSRQKTYSIRPGPRARATSVTENNPIRLFVTLRKKGGHMVVDWTGTSPQVKGAINNTL